MLTLSKFLDDLATLLQQPCWHLYRRYSEDAAFQRTTSDSEAGHANTEPLHGADVDQELLYVRFFCHTYELG